MPSGAGLTATIVFFGMLFMFFLFVEVLLLERYLKRGVVFLKFWFQSLILSFGSVIRFTDLDLWAGDRAPYAFSTFNIMICSICVLLTVDYSARLITIYSTLQRNVNGSKIGTVKVYAPQSRCY